MLKLRRLSRRQLYLYLFVTLLKVNRTLLAKSHEPPIIGDWDGLKFRV